MSRMISSHRQLSTGLHPAIPFPALAVISASMLLGACGGGGGGGYLDIASEVAYLIAGPTPTAGQTFELDQFNSKYPTTNPVTQTALTPLGFHTTTQGFSVTSGQALPSLNLSRVFVLTTAGTCSASESIINSLQGVNVQVIEIGTTTCGKPYGFYPADNCAVTYFSIQFQGVNAKNFGDYPDGFTPENTVATQGVLVPGCSVADDFTHALGDPAEGQLASALSYRTNAVCPLPPSSVTPPSQVPAQSIKSFWRQNRIYRAAAPR
jgi:carboxyl-terminal processing protease